MHNRQTRSGRYGGKGISKHTPVKRRDRLRHNHTWVLRTDVPQPFWCKVCVACQSVVWIARTGT